ncbi:unnamed protein product [Eruca vesicaria subsp. sativa]|uniref:DBINO domain-containing protein n=1 Tax=Eruca vesicaria subsp. sativa TaxID=29727 RepID=A0ABC8L8I6_ERUVS|nr:unnamed protein product [Eruca vesicaria subsp. sativa]
MAAGLGLSKARLSRLVVATSGTGYILGTGNGVVDLAGHCYTCAGLDPVPIVQQNLPKKLKVKNDPAVIEKTERDKIRKAWINIVRRDIPKHHRVFTNFHRKQSIDAKRFADGCQRKMIRRSHEGPDARSDREDMGNMLYGYSVDHEVESGNLYTIFSASNLSQVEKLLFLEVKTSNVLIGMVNTEAERCTVYDGSYEMENIFDFLGKNNFLLIQKLTESNRVWVTLALLSFRFNLQLKLSKKLSTQNMDAFINGELKPRVGFANDEL